jgi:hypothetical protein
VSQLSEAQLWKIRRYEVSGGLGPSIFSGDVGGYSNGENIIGLKDMSFLQTRVNVNANAKYRISQAFNARLSLSYGKLKATDERGSNPERGYEASTTVFEPALICEYYFIKNKAENSYTFVNSGRKFLKTLFSSLDFYAFGGIGGASYSVKPNEALENSGGFNSGGFTAVIPAGVGTTLIYSPDLNFGFEIGYRYTFSDYLDGYTSQYSSANDVYYFLNFNITYKLKTGKNGWPSFR